MYEFSTIIIGLFSLVLSAAALFYIIKYEKKRDIDQIRNKLSLAVQKSAALWNSGKRNTDSEWEIIVLFDSVMLQCRSHRLKNISPLVMVLYNKATGDMFQSKFSSDEQKAKQIIGLWRTIDEIFEELV